MNPELQKLLNHMEMFDEVNKSDIPTLIKLIRQLNGELLRTEELVETIKNCYGID